MFIITWQDSVGINRAEANLFSTTYLKCAVSRDLLLYCALKYENVARISGNRLRRYCYFRKYNLA